MEKGRPISEQKPKLSTKQLIEKMKDKGITFQYFGEEEAADYLLIHNNYLRLASYRKNYDKHEKGENAGKYIALDFAYLKEMAIIDMLLRRPFLQMCIDVEHSLKMLLLSHLENTEEDGYDIVRRFFKNYPYVIQNIEKKLELPYVGDLISNYTVEVASGAGCDFVNSVGLLFNLELPVWILIEVISFGDFCSFYEFYYKIYGNAPIGYNVIKCIKSLRNACAHNNCILHDIRTMDTHSCPEIDRFLKNMGETSDTVRKNLRRRPIYEIICLLYVYDKVVSPNVKKHGFYQLCNLFKYRMVQNKHFFKDHQILKSCYNMVSKIIDKLFTCEYNN